MYMNLNIPFFNSDDSILNRAWGTAIGDIVGNIAPYQAGLLQKEVPCLIAGHDYSTPWTRDAAINTMLSLAFLSPDVAKNTLLSVCSIVDGKRIVSGWGQDWDAVIWILGAYQYWQVTDDSDFYPLMCEIAQNTLACFEKSAYDTELGLFRGPAVYGDGVSAYPDKFGCIKQSGIIGCPYHMYTLSTNCVYEICYRIASDVGIPGSLPIAQQLRNSINQHFWNEETKRYDYIAGECSYQEGLGLSLALLSDIAEPARAHQLITHTQLTPNGLACVYPSFERYKKSGGIGRHSGTIWPFIHGFWGLALRKYGYTELFDQTLYALAHKACRDGQFAELYHGDTGEIYGGLQEDAPNGVIRMWRAGIRQSWSASAFVALIVYGLFGCQWNKGRMKYHPQASGICQSAKLYGLQNENRILEMNNHCIN